MSNGYSGQERRKFKRTKANFIVMFKVDSPLDLRFLFGSRENDAIMLDLGEGGAGILTNLKVPSLAMLAIKFILVNPNAFKEEERVRPIEAKGEVRYNLFTKEEAYRLGICFTNIAENDWHLIANFTRMAKSA